MCPPGQVGTPPNCVTPPPPMCPPGQVGTPPNCTTPPPKRVFEGSGTTAGVFLRGGGRVVKYVFGGLLDAAADSLEESGQAAGVIETLGSSNLHEVYAPRAAVYEVYAPRAAVYEALPGFLLRLNGGGA